MTNIDKLQTTFRKALQVPIGVDVTSSQYGDAPGGKHWDSLQHMVLCTLLEDAFDVMIDIEHVSQIRSYASAAAILAHLGVDFEA
jgi:acyl carrier protein